MIMSKLYDEPFQIYENSRYFPHLSVLVYHFMVFYLYISDDITTITINVTITVAWLRYHFCIIICFCSWSRPSM